MSRDDVQSFASLLRKARDEQGMSQKDLAEKTGLQITAISLFETGRRSPSMENLMKLATGLNVSLDYLTGRHSPDDVETPELKALFRKSRTMPKDKVIELNEFADFLVRKKPAK